MLLEWALETFFEREGGKERERWESWERWENETLIGHLPKPSYVSQQNRTRPFSVWDDALTNRSTPVRARIGF